MPVCSISEAQGVNRISLAWSNSFALTDASGDCWLIDTGLQSDRQALLACLSQAAIEPDKVRAVVLTHAHCDHAGSAAYFCREFGAELYVHRAEIAYLDESGTVYGGLGVAALRRPIQSLAFRMGERLFPVERCPAIRSFEDGDKLPAPGGMLTVIHTPGHTPGHIALYRESDGVLFSGDAVLNIVPHLLRSRRRVGLSLAPRIFTSDVKKSRDSARILADLQPTVLASGHGPVLAQNTAVALEQWVRSLDIRQQTYRPHR